MDQLIPLSIVANSFPGPATFQRLFTAIEPNLHFIKIRGKLVTCISRSDYYRLVEYSQSLVQQIGLLLRAGTPNRNGDVFTESLLRNIQKTLGKVPHVVIMPSEDRNAMLARINQPIPQMKINFTLSKEI